jgi:hypothetical protein
MYQLTTGSTIKRLLDGAFIPADPANIDYRLYLEWANCGNTPAPADPPPVVPEPTPEQKLAAAGLSLDELKQLLGL